MKLFGQLVRTMVNVVELPVALVKDAVTLGGAIDNNGKSHTLEQLNKLAEDAEEK